MMLEMTLKVVIMQGRSFYRSKLQTRVFEYAFFFFLSNYCMHSGMHFFTERRKGSGE